MTLESKIRHFELNNSLESIVVEFSEKGFFEDPLMHADCFLNACFTDALTSGDAKLINHRFVRKLSNSLMERQRWNLEPYPKRLRELAAAINKIPGSNRRVQSQALLALSEEVGLLPVD
jgi:hypothetical protein